MNMHQVFEDLMTVVSVERRTAVFYDDEYLRHDTGAHPETAKRLQRIMDVLTRDPIWKKILPLKPRSASVEEVGAVHPLDYIESIEQACRQGLRFLDADTIISPRSYDVALLAVGALLTAIDGLIAGQIDNALALVRPPGHHAGAQRAMGFCIFNNVAVAARYAQHKHNLDRVAIIDWDVHHGNGTQQIFYTDPTVLYISMHQYPLYPGTGSRSETGAGEGRGYTLNLPLAPGGDDDVYLTAFRDRILPKLDEFKPRIILISAGFDAHTDDPLASMNVTDRGFARMTDLLVGYAADSCRGRLISVLEGGYNLLTLPYTVLDHLYALAGARVAGAGYASNEA